MPEMLLAIILLTGTYTAYRWIDGGGWEWALAAGTCWGALGLVKPEAALLPLAVVPAGFILAKDRWRFARQTAVAVMMWGGLIGAWLYRNYEQFGRVCMITGSGSDGDKPGPLHYYRLRAENGVTFWPMRYKYLYGDRWEEAEAVYQAAVEGSVQDPEMSDVEFWLRHPGLLAKYTGVRFIGLMKPESHSETFGLDRDFGEYKESRQYIQLAAKAGLLLVDATVIGIGLIGFTVSLLPRHRRLWIVTATLAYFIAVYSLLHGIARYRDPFMPLLTLLGVWWLSRCWMWLRKPSVESADGKVAASAIGE
jgi:hypothetical protein